MIRDPLTAAMEAFERPTSKLTHTGSSYANHTRNLARG